MAFAMLLHEKPNSHLYLHMEPSNAYGGFLLPRLLKACGVPPEKVTVADSEQLRIGYPVETMAAIYTASDVLLMPSLGEGFGIPLIEAQSCGTPVITGSWTAMQDLAGPSSWILSGQPFWDETQASFYQIPLLGSIVDALKMAHDAERGVDDEAREFAKQFDVEVVWRDKWLPFFQDYFTTPQK
jgi:glycosyltransferase involved in cell wall biosynthesis